MTNKKLMFENFKNWEEARKHLPKNAVQIDGTQHFNGLATIGSELWQSGKNTWNLEFCHSDRGSWATLTKVDSEFEVRDSWVGSQVPEIL